MPWIEFHRSASLMGDIPEPYPAIRHVPEWLKAITGIVETGSFYKQVSQPMICLMRPGDVFVLPRGAPMIQVIPFRRDDWSSRSALIDEPRAADQIARLAANPHIYKDDLWKKLRYS